MEVEPKYGSIMSMTHGPKGSLMTGFRDLQLDRVSYIWQHVWLSGMEHKPFLYKSL